MVGGVATAPGCRQQAVAAGSPKLYTGETIRKSTHGVDEGGAERDTPTVTAAEPLPSLLASPAVIRR